jgi:hypothetical protein
LNPQPSAIITMTFSAGAFLAAPAPEADTIVNPNARDITTTRLSTRIALRLITPSNLAASSLGF